MNEDFLDEDAPGIELLPRQQRFCDEYLIDLNASAAARRAGYSEKNAANTAWKLLELRQVRNYIEQRVKRINERLVLATQTMAGELSDLVMAKHGDFLDTDGDIKNLAELPENLRSAVHIQTKRVKKGGQLITSTTYNLYNRTRIIEKFGLRLLDKKKEPSYQDNSNRNYALFPDGSRRYI